MVQVRNNTLNEDPEMTSNKMEKSIFETNLKEIAIYLNLWHSEDPIFARETSDHFINIHRSRQGIQPEEVNSVIENVKERLSILNSVNTKKFPEGGGEWLNYFKLSKEFYISFPGDHFQFVKAFGLVKDHQYNEVRTEIEQTYPDKTIDIYQKTISQLDPTIGENAIVILLSLQWLPDYRDLKQLVGIAPILINFAKTQHDLLAQGAGRYTSFTDNQKQLWVKLGNKELGEGKPGESENWLKTVSESLLIFEGKSEILVCTMRKHQFKPCKYAVEVIYPKNGKGYFNIFFAKHEFIGHNQKCLM